MARTIVPPNPPRPKSAAGMLIRKPHVLAGDRLCPIGLYIGPWRRHPNTKMDIAVADVDVTRATSFCATTAAVTYSQTLAMDPNERAAMLRQKLVEAGLRASASLEEINEALAAR